MCWFFPIKTDSGKLYLLRGVYDKPKSALHTLPLRAKYVPRRHEASYSKAICKAQHKISRRQEENTSRLCLLGTPHRAYPTRFVPSTSETAIIIIVAIRHNLINSAVKTKNSWRTSPRPQFCILHFAFIEAFCTLHSAFCIQKSEGLSTQLSFPKAAEIYLQFVDKG